MMTHEPAVTHKKLNVASNQSLGYTFAILLFCAGIWPWLFNDSAVNLWFFIVSLILFNLAFFLPRVLEPVNRLWFKLGIILQFCITPIVMALLFFLLVTPTAILMNLMGWDLLKLRRSKCNSYWKSHEDSNQEKSSMRNQY